MVRILIVFLATLGVGLALSGRVGVVHLPPEVFGLPLSVFAFGAVVVAVIAALRSL